MKDNHFPFQSTKEAWDLFDAVARKCFQRLLEQEKLTEKVKTLKNYDYCARLMYILNIFAYEGEANSEFGIDWALLLARPLSALQAQRSMKDLIALGIIAEDTTPFTRKIPGSTEPKLGTNTYESKFDFDG